MKMPSNEFELLKIETYVLKVHMNCQGCMLKVRKLLRKVEGVYKVRIDADEQKVTVTGSVDSAILINKLVRSGKHAELWSPSSNNKHDELFNNSKNQNQTQYLINGLDPSKDQPTSPTFGRVDNDWRSEWYINQSRGAKTVTGEFNHNLTAAMQNLGLGGDGVTIGDHGNFQNKTIPMHDHAGFLGNDAGFAALGGHELGAYGGIYEGLPIYEYDHPLSNMMTNRRVSHYTYPPTDMMNYMCETTPQSTFHL
ncbi:hypothetical protein ACB098_01G181400 [Castanea mollissima]